MPDLVNAFFEVRLEQLFDLAGLAEQLFSSGGLEYRIVGGLATYLYVEEREPDAGRLTKDIDIVVRRADLEKIAKAAVRLRAWTCWFGLNNHPDGGPSTCIRSRRLTSAHFSESRVCA